MMKKRVAAAILVASLCGAPVAMAQTAGGNNGAANGGANTTGNGAANNGGANNNNGGANNGSAYNGASNNGMPSQRVANERSNGQGAILTISPSGVREVQQALNRLGYQAGPVNGVWDRSVADAMVHFQQAHGLEPTGDLTFSSIAALGLWNNLIGDPNGNGNKALTAGTGAPPPRGGKNAANIGGSPLPSQRITNETTGNAAAGATGAGNSANRR